MRYRLAAIVIVLLGGTAVVAHADTIAYTISGPPGLNGWYKGPVLVQWTISGLVMPPTNCEQLVSLTKDTRGTTVSCTVTWASDGSTETKTTPPIRIDQTPPVATAATPSRPPDFAAWFNHPLTIAWSGTDNFTANPACTTTTYAGPDNGAATLVGTCSDEAGNVSAPLPFTLAYDATPPTLAPPIGVAGDRTATLTWQASPDTAAITVTRSPGVAAAASVVYRGDGRGFADHGLRDEVTYHYVVVATDAAGNAVQQAVAVTPGKLTAPAPGARLTAPPLLRWIAVRHARYYNVQLFRGGRKVLSAWPTKLQLELRRTWRFGGRRQRLVPGTYRWFVWPGYGRRSQRRYGRLLGWRSFTVVA
jgi:hypothetical protein